MSVKIDVSSQWYPYPKVSESYFDLSGSVNLPRKICDYLIDAPQKDYAPPDNNAYSRCRLWKYLFYDGEKPLANTLPTIEQKMSVVFDPENPTEPPTDKGYRLIPQIYVAQAQKQAQTRIMCYMGRTIPRTDNFGVSIAVIFDIYTHYTYELNTKTDAYSRVFAMEQALIEALHGVNMDGAGSFSFSKASHPDCGSRVIYDDDMNIGRQVIISLEIPTSTAAVVGETDNMPKIGKGIYLV